MILLLALLAVSRAEDPPAPLIPEVPPPVVPVAPAAPDPAIAELRQQLAELQLTVAAQSAQLQVQSATLAEQTAALAKQRDEQVDLKKRVRSDSDLKFDLDGYYRVRGYIFSHTYAAQGTGRNYRDARWLTHRLYLQPKISYKNLATFFAQFQAFDNSAFGTDGVFGDNESIAPTALFATEPSSTTTEGLPASPISVRRAWMEVTLPVGVLRAGRMTSQWGMGLLANGGDGFDDAFGENHFGSTNDRVLFATRPIAIGQKIAGKKDSNIPFFVAVGVDRLVEDPLFQFYGYNCEPNVNIADPAYDARCDSNDDGLTDLEHALVDEERTPQDRNLDWAMDQNDDVWEMVYVAAYRGEGVRYFGDEGDLTAGVYVVNRIQNETDSRVLISDAYFKARNHGVILEFEGLHIGGDTRAIALAGAYDPSGEGDPLRKKASITGYAARAGLEGTGWSTIFEHGFASGDHNVADEKFTGRPLHPDFNVGLLLYEEVLARVTAAGWSENARPLWSNGGVYNSRYIFPTAHLYMRDKTWDIVGAFLVAWPHQADGAFILCREGDRNECAAYEATSPILGTEVDFAIKHRWHEHALMSLEAGYAHATDRLPLENAGLDPEGNYFTFQSRLAYEF